ncbi:hypothetical protein ABSA28_01056 [Candidatus Hepatincolaceae symbiont of Richtersius coronifer]
MNKVVLNLLALVLITGLFYTIQAQAIITPLAIATDPTSATNNSIKSEVTSKPNNNFYKVTRERDYLSCLTPFSVEGINKLYLKDDNNEIIYVIEIQSFNGTCQWERDKLLFKKKTPQSEIKQVLENYNTNLYMNTNFTITFFVRKIRTDVILPINHIEVPYFVILNNKSNDNIVIQKSYKINLILPTKGEKVYTTTPITIAHGFPIEDFSNMEIISGIYFNSKY